MLIKPGQTPLLHSSYNSLNRRQIITLVMDEWYSHSNLFMGHWEEKFVLSSQNVYIDKIICRGGHILQMTFSYFGLDQNQNFMSFSIKQQFTLYQTIDNISFLDLKISKDDVGGYIQPFLETQRTVTPEQTISTLPG